MKKVLWIYMMRETLEELGNLVKASDEWEGVFAEIEEIDQGKGYETYAVKCRPDENIELYDGANLVKVE